MWNTIFEMYPERIPECYGTNHYGLSLMQKQTRKADLCTPRSADAVHGL